MTVAPPPRILLLGPDPSAAARFKASLREEGFECRLVDPEQGLDQVGSADGTQLVIADVRGTPAGWAALAGAALSWDPELPVILLTDRGSLGAGITALEEGVFDVLMEPFSRLELHLAVQRALRYRALVQARAAGGRPPRSPEVVELEGSSPAIRLIVQKIRAVAATDASILITGEAGAGKARIARAIHDYSPRREHPFVAVEAVSLARETESEGAVDLDGVRARQPLLREGNRGTLFIQGLEHLEPAAQRRLLSRLEDSGEGGRPADLRPRIIAAAGDEVDAWLERGRFDPELFDRVAEVRVHLPPLRARGEDLVELVSGFLSEFCAEAGRETPVVAPEVWVTLGRNRWPGNVSQLKALARELALRDEDGRITLDDLPDEVRFPAPAGPGERPRDAERLPLEYEEARERALLAFRKAYVRRLLAAHEGNVSRAAATAGVSRRTLHRWLAELQSAAPLPRNGPAPEPA